MEISSLIDFYLDPATNASQQDLKPLKAPDCDQDVQRFESILKGEGPYQPKSLDLVMPATDPNAIQNVGEALLDKVTRLKTSAENRKNRIDEKLKTIVESDDINMADVIELQWEVNRFSIETLMLTKSGDKAGDGIKTMFRNQ